MFKEIMNSVSVFKAYGHGEGSHILTRVCGAAVMCSVSKMQPC